MGEVLITFLDLWITCQIIACMALVASLPITGPIFLKMYEVYKLEQMIAWINENPKEFTAFILRSASSK